MLSRNTPTYSSTFLAYFQNSRDYKNKFLVPVFPFKYARKLIYTHDYNSLYPSLLKQKLIVVRVVI